ncbi:MAG: glycosyltransferase family 4 protein [Acidobacteria bacterium]|nr:glycosyltransferase family 4 protein [Acidobacteriota bacterium]
MKVVQVNCVFDRRLTDPEALLERYTTLTGWSEALLAAGADHVAVVQRFSRGARLTRNDVDYVFVDDGGPGRPPPWRWSTPAAHAVATLTPDVVHVNGLDFPMQVRKVRSVLPCASALVVQSHAGGGMVGRAPATRLLGRVARSVVDAFLFAAGEHADSARRAGLIAPRQLTYIVMPASTTFRPVSRGAAREASGIAGAPAVLWVGRLTARKDPLTVLDGFERSLPHLPEATLTMIYGTDELLPDVRRRIDASIALRGRVRLVGEVPHKRMPMYFSAADVFVVGSHREGSGYSLMEACACGLIPAVTDIPTFRLLTADGELGALWRPGDAVDCGRALIQLGAHDLAQRRAHVEHHFARELSWTAVGRRALDIYADVLKNRRQRMVRDTQPARF